MRHRTAHLSPVPSRYLEIHAGEENGGNGGGGATRARIWASDESCVGGSGGERGDGSDEHGGVFWAGSRRERTMPPWRQPATTSAQPRWLDAGVRTRAYLDIHALGGETDFLWRVWSLLMLVLLSVWWLPSCPSLVYCGHLVCSFTCSCWARGARRGSRRGRIRVVLACGRKGVSDPEGRRPAPAHMTYSLVQRSLPVSDNLAGPLPRRTVLLRALRIERQCGHESPWEGVT